MFENLITSIKNQTNNFADTLKSKSRKLSNNLNILKNKKSSTTTTNYYTVTQINESDYFNNDYLSPRACSLSYNSNYNSINDNMEWVPYVPSTYDEQNIVDRFIKVITINNDEFNINRRTDREEIRRRLALGSEDDYYNNFDRPGRKPSLHSRLQNGMNLQICFMNETPSDTESPNSDTECQMTIPKQLKANKTTIVKNELTDKSPNTKSVGQPIVQNQQTIEIDFFARQAKLQTEARMALAQAKEMARMQMEIERQRQKKSPITEMVRNSLEKVGIQYPEDRRRLSLQILNEMNLAQLQVIVNDLHTQIETLNENLVKYLMDRDDLHMEQDSMLVDIEDLTQYLGSKEQPIQQNNDLQQNNNIPPLPSPAPPTSLNVKPRFSKITSLVKK